MTKTLPYSTGKISTTILFSVLMMFSFGEASHAQGQGGVWASQDNPRPQSQSAPCQSSTQDPEIQDWLDALSQSSNHSEEYTDSSSANGFAKEEDGVTRDVCGKGDKMDKGWCEPKCGKGDKMDKGSCETKVEEGGKLLKDAMLDDVAGIENQPDLTKKDPLIKIDIAGDSRSRKILPSDPVFKKLVDSIVLSPTARQLAGRKTSIEPVMTPPASDVLELEGVETPFPSIFNLWGNVAFEVRQDPKGDQSGGVIAKTAGVYPDRLSAIRESLNREISEVNSLFYDSIIYKEAKNLAEMELEALDRQITYETIRLEAGVGEPEKLASARARAVQAEVDYSTVSRKARMAANGFLTKTGVRVEDVPDSDTNWLFEVQPLDINFSLIADNSILQSQGTEDAVGRIHEASSDILNSGEELLAQKLCTAAAEEALRKTQVRMGSGGSGEADLAGVEALLLGAQKKELIALARYVRAHSRAYTSTEVREASTKIDPVNISSGPTDKDGGMTWFLVVAVFLMIAAVVIGFYRSPDHRDSKPVNSPGSEQ